MYINFTVEFPGWAQTDQQSNPIIHNIKGLNNITDHLPHSCDNSSGIPSLPQIHLFSINFSLNIINSIA